MFPGARGDLCGAGTLDVPCAPLNAANVSTSLRGANPVGATPTASGLMRAAQTLGDRTPVLDQARGRAGYVLLVTDGEPSCDILGGVLGTPDQGQRDAAIAAVQAPRALDYYAAESSAAITAAFRAITKDVVRCDFELTENADPTRVDITIDGKRIDLDPANGWTINGSTVTLVGGSCDTLKDGTGHALNVEVVCEPLR